MSDPSDVKNALVQDQALPIAKSSPLTPFPRMRGHKAAIHNPNVSEEAKEHSRQVLEAMEGKDKTGAGGENPTSVSDGTTSEGKDAGNV